MDGWMDNMPWFAPKVISCCSCCVASIKEEKRDDSNVVIGANHHIFHYIGRTPRFSHKTVENVIDKY